MCMYMYVLLTNELKQKMKFGNKSGKTFAQRSRKFVWSLVTNKKICFLYGRMIK